MYPSLLIVAWIRFVVVLSPQSQSLKKEILPLKSEEFSVEVLEPTDVVLLFWDFWCLPTGMLGALCIPFLDLDALDDDTFWDAILRSELDLRVLDFGFGFVTGLEWDRFCLDVFDDEGSVCDPVDSLILKLLSFAIGLKGAEAFLVAGELDFFELRVCRRLRRPWLSERKLLSDVEDDDVVPPCGSPLGLSDDCIDDDDNANKLLEDVDFSCCVDLLPSRGMLGSLSEAPEVDALLSES